ncbi:MAG: hypothetical protein ACRDY2_08055 [Acidimicrobiales bacterium]
MASTTEAVKDYQRRLAQLAAAHAKAEARWQAATARRAEVAAAQDRLVADAEEAMNHSVAELATIFGAEVAAKVAGLEPTEVRRMSRAGPAMTATEGRPGSTMGAGSPRLTRRRPGR